MTGRTLTYGEMIDAVYRWGAVVKNTSSSENPVVGIFMNNSPDYAPIFLGTIVVGGIASTLNSTYTASGLFKFEMICA